MHITVYKIAGTYVQCHKKCSDTYCSELEKTRTSVDMQISTVHMYIQFSGAGTVVMNYRCSCHEL